jgi:hypothetical protein
MYDPVIVIGFSRLAVTVTVSMVNQRHKRNFSLSEIFDFASGNCPIPS